MPPRALSVQSWTAAPGAGIGPDQFALFRISVKLPEWGHLPPEGQGDQTVTLPATQTYSGGTLVQWDQPTPPGGAEPEYPAPELALTGAKADAADDHPMPVAQATAPDNSARWLAGGALAVAAVAVATALLVRRRA